MASVRVKFRPSTIEGKKGVIYYQIIQNRVIRQINTDYRILPNEWNDEVGDVIIDDSERSDLLLFIKERMEWELKRLNMIIMQQEGQRILYTADDIVSSFKNNIAKQSFLNFMQEIIVTLRQMGKYRTSETYQTTLKSFMQFRENKDLLLYEITSDLMQMYEVYLKKKEFQEILVRFI